MRGASARAGAAAALGLALLAGCGTTPPQTPEAGDPPDAGAYAPVWTLAGQTLIGLAPGPGEQAPAVGRHGEASIRHGRLTDASRAEDIARYLARRPTTTLPQLPSGESQHSATTFERRQTVVVDPQASASLAKMTVEAVRLLNAALPRHARLALAQGATPGEAGLETPDTIPVRATPLGGLILGYGHTTIEDGRKTAAHVDIATEALQWVEEARDAATRAERWQSMREVVVHELIHAIALEGHVDGQRFPESLMHAVRGVGPERATLGRIDQDVLLASHTVTRPVGSREEVWTDLGGWRHDSLHLSAEIEAARVRFGVIEQQGQIRAWAAGPTPEMHAPQRPELAGGAQWSGRLLGLTPQAEAVAGSAKLDIAMTTLDGTLSLADLEHWQASQPPGALGSGTRWGRGRLDYDIVLDGNRFRQTGGDAGVVTGALLGPAHEGAAGTLERDDLSAAFGAARRTAPQ